MCLSFPPFGSRSYFCLRDERRAKKVFFGAPYSSTDLKISGVGRPHANLIYSISGGKEPPIPVLWDVGPGYQSSIGLLGIFVSFISVTYFVTYGTAIACYAYFVLTKQEYLFKEASDRQYLLNFYKRAQGRERMMDAVWNIGFRSGNRQGIDNTRTGCPERVSSYCASCPGQADGKPENAFSQPRPRIILHDCN